MDTNKQQPFEFYSTSGYKLSTDPFVWVFETRDPTPQDVNYPQQKQWLNVTLQKVWILTSFSSITGQVLAVWTEVSSSVADLNSLTGDDAVAVNPVNNNINFFGSATGAFETVSGGVGIMEGSVRVDGTTIQINGLNQLEAVSTAIDCNFRAYLTADAVGVTGNGATYTLSNLTELYDVGNDLDPVTGIFTVPTTGYYVLMASVSLANLTVLMDSANVKIRNTTATNDVAIFNLGNPWARAGGNSQQDLSTVSVTDYLTAGDQIVVQAVILNGAGDTANVSAGRGVTYFAGYFLGA